VADFVGAIDQGTTSTRFMLFDAAGREVARHQLEHEQVLPRAGWVEHNPTEIWERTETVVRTVLTRQGIGAADLAAVGITNQRETTVVWDRRTGRPLHNAIVWQDTRTDRIAAQLERDGAGELLRQRAGLRRAGARAQGVFAAALVVGLGDEVGVLGGGVAAGLGQDHVQGRGDRGRRVAREAHAQDQHPERHQAQRQGGAEPLGRADDRCRHLRRDRPGGLRWPRTAGRRCSARTGRRARARRSGW